MVHKLQGDRETQRHIMVDRESASLGQLILAVDGPQGDRYRLTPPYYIHSSMYCTILLDIVGENMSSRSRGLFVPSIHSMPSCVIISCCAARTNKLEIAANVFIVGQVWFVLNMHNMYYKVMAQQMFMCLLT